MQNLKIWLIVVLISVSVQANSNIDILFVNFIEKVSQQNNINIYIDEDIKDKTVSLFIPDKISNKNLLKLFKNTIKKMSYNLKKRGNNYYLSKIEEPLSNKYLYKLKYNSYKDCKSILGILKVQHSYLEDTNSILISSTQNSYETTKRFLDKIDIKQKQVILKITIYEYQEENIKERGVKFGTIYKGIDGTIETALNTLVAPLSTKGNILDNTDFYSALRLLNEDNKVTIKQTPYVLAKNNKSFKFEAVDNIPYLVTTTKTDAANTSEQNSIEYKDVGLKIDGKAFVYDDYVTLNMDLIVEDIVSVIDNTPQTYKRRLNSITDVPYKKVLLLSGLKRTKHYTNDYSIPYISNIPLLGSIFQYKTDNQSQLNITIAIEVIDTNKEAIRGAIHESFSLRASSKKSQRV
ncbi:type II secretion system protein GspD [Sulfurimonas sp.]